MRATPASPTIPRCDGLDGLLEEALRFEGFRTPTLETTTEVPHGGASIAIPTLVNEFWTAKQRAGSSLHEVSYRACFKPQLPGLFIGALTDPGDLVLDPFLGRGTTILEAALQGRVGVGKDVNPLSVALTAPRLDPPTMPEVTERLESIPRAADASFPEELLVFYHPRTLQAICTLRSYLLARAAARELDRIDDWIRMVAINRLTGHSGGFFSVYSLPPNQAVSLQAQRQINEKRKQTPPQRDVAALIVRKSHSLLRNIRAAERAVLSSSRERHQLLVGDSRDLGAVAPDSVSLLVTSPPFLDVVNYASDNWLRCWFLGIDASAIEVSIERGVDGWCEAMTDVLRAAWSRMRPGGVVAFEVGEVRAGRVRLEEHAARAGLAAGFDVRAVLINQQEFTKTANCWGIDNNKKGTNSNRIVLMTRPG